MNPEPLVCLLCGNPNRSEVRIQLVSWLTPTSEQYQAIPRCLDRTACRARCEAIDEPWLVKEPA